MADPISIIGLVSGIITFVDFGLKIISEVDKVRHPGANGTSDEIDELQGYIDKVHDWNTKIKKQRESGLHLSREEERVLEEVYVCEKLVKELQGLIADLKTKDGVRPRAWETTKVAFRRRWRQSDIDKLQKRLHDMYERIRRDFEGALQL